MKSKFVLLSLMVLMAFSSRAQEETLIIQDTIPSEWLYNICINGEEVPKFPNNLITNQDQYEILNDYFIDIAEYMDECKTLPHIDFKKNSLIVIKTKYYGCEKPIDVKTWFGKCINSRYVVNIEVHSGACRHGEGITTYFVKIPKINQSIPIQAQERGRSIDF